MTPQLSQALAVLKETLERHNRAPASQIWPIIDALEALMRPIEPIGQPIGPIEERRVEA